MLVFLSREGVVFIVSSLSFHLTMVHVLSPPVSEANWRSLSQLWGSAPPPCPKMAPSFTGSAYSPFPGYKTVVSSLCWPLTLLHHIPNRLLAILSHVSSISAGFQLPPPTPTRWARPCLSFLLSLPCPQFQTGSRKFWIQATTHAAVGHKPIVLCRRGYISRS
jgi:hypothetical protein